MRATRSRRRGLLELLVLTSIIEHGRIHGYGIYKKLVDSAPSYWKPSIGTLYRVLNSLVVNGLVTRAEAVVNGRRVVYYSVTDKGVDEFFKIAECILNKIYAGVKLLLPALASMKTKDNRVDYFNTVFENIYTLLKNYLGK